MRLMCLCVGGKDLPTCRTLAFSGGNAPPARVVKSPCMVAGLEADVPVPWSLSLTFPSTTYLRLPIPPLPHNSTPNLLL